jgi:ATP-binding cassette subfamily C exporter for protease/lipase
VRSRLLVRLGVRLDMTLNPRVFDAAFGMRARGENGDRLLDDLARLRQFLTGAGLFALLDAPWTPLYILVLFLLHPALGLLGIVFCLILAAVAYLCGRAMEEPLETADKANRIESAHLDSRLRQAAALEVMGMMGRVRQDWVRRHVVSVLQGRRGLDVQARMQAMIGFVRLMQQSLCLGAGAVLTIQGEISVGAMVAANALMSRATHPLDALIKAWKDIIAAREAFLTLEHALAEHPIHEAVPLKSEVAGATLRLNRVIATAAGREQPILRDVSLTISAGVALGVKGPSGSGKSTLARVLLGIWPEMQGEALIDGESIRRFDRTELGSKLGYLPQDVALFEGTIAENIARFGKVDSALVIEACRMAGVHDMILRLPKGYETQVGEGGAFLSGGQRQRIGLARALYGNPRLVVLDEPNSSLDDAGDRALLQAVLSMKKRGTTLVLISHRPQIMAAMDRVLIMEAGCVVRLDTPSPVPAQTIGSMAPDSMVTSAVIPKSMAV